LKRNKFNIDVVDTGGNIDVKISLSVGDSAGNRCCISFLKKGDSSIFKCLAGNFFENLPGDFAFDDANNDGYIAFKIKTLPTLVVGDTFSNKASIYFDYNFPIITNKATTVIAVPLSANDFTFSENIVLYPNPAGDYLNIKSSGDIESYAIFNMLGQQLMYNTIENSTIDISGLARGNYILRVISNNGAASAKFIKQ
jgi:hypothetical protein